MLRNVLAAWVISMGDLGFPRGNKQEATYFVHHAMVEGRLLPQY